MIKDLSIVIFIILCVVIGHFFIQNILRENRDELVSSLESLKEKIADGNSLELKEHCEELYELWKEKNLNLEIIIDHQEVDNIEILMLNIKSSINFEDMDEIGSKIDQCIFLISHIADKEKLDLKNIF